MQPLSSADAPDAGCGGTRATSTAASTYPIPLLNEIASLRAELEVERQARLQAEERARWDVGERLNEKLHMLASARCLLWHAEVRVDADVLLRWHFHLPSINAAHRFLPVSVQSGQAFLDAWYDARLAEDRETSDGTARDAVLAGRDYEVEYRCRLLDGSLRWIHEDVQVETLEESRYWRLVGVCTDVTARKEAEEERDRLSRDLKRSHAHLQAVVDQMPCGLVIAEAPSGRLVLHNAAAARILGHSLLPGDMTEDLAHYGALHDDGTMFRPAEYVTERALSGETVRHDERRYIGPDGAVLWLSASAAPMYDEAGALVGAIATFETIDERKQAEETARSLSAAVQQEKDRLSALLNSMSDEVWFLDAQKRLTPINPAAGRVYDFDVAEGIDMEQAPASLGVHRLDGSPLPVAEAASLRAFLGETVRNYENVLRVPATGELRHRQISAAPVNDAAGNIVGSVAVVRDITERRLAQETVRQSEALLDTMMSAAPIGIGFLDNQLCYQRVNSALAEMNGLPADGHIGHTAEEVVPAIGPQLTAIHERVLATGHPVVNREVKGRTPAVPGEDRVWLVSYYPVRDADGQMLGIGIVMQEITERKRHVQEVESLNARLQRSMAETHHRVKNNLQVIAALIEMQSEGFQSAIPAEDVRALGYHVRGLAAIHDLLTQESKTGPTVDSLSMQAALGKLLPLLQATLHDRRLRAEIDDVRIPVRKIGALALLMNELVCNAAKHGRGDVGVRSRVDKDTVRFVVDDRGPGFPCGFNPILAANTGLELVMQLARHDLGGTIVFENRPEGGARAVLDFPVAG